jgi:hypothetical protein
MLTLQKINSSSCCLKSFQGILKMASLPLSSSPFKRVETDTMGKVDVPNDKYYGAQTARSIDNFPIGVGKYTWDRSIIKALGILKKSAALANADLGQIPGEIAALIVVAADEVISGKHDDHFPLVIFQTGMDMYSCMLMCICINFCIHLFICMYIYPYINIYISLFIYICIHPCIPIYMNLCILYFNDVSNRIWNSVKHER